MVKRKDTAKERGGSIDKKKKTVVTFAPNGDGQIEEDIHDEHDDEGAPGIRGPPNIIPRYLRFADLVERGVVGNRETLRNWIAKENFPQGIRAGPNVRLWRADEVLQWLNSRPVAVKIAAPARRPRGRPRKAERQAETLNERSQGP
jgi:predicted DNA-binding transcriptional regulator AlpA